MLSDEDRKKAEDFQKFIAIMKEHSSGNTLMFTFEQAQWLADKVIELDNGFRMLLSENEKMNEEMIAMAERDER